MKTIITILFLSLSCAVFAADPIEKHPEWDQEYSKKIREYTTSPEFLTDLVDHLPASDKVPTPEKFHGYIAGAPDKLTYSEDVYKYMRALQEASPRVKVISIGKSEEGREMIVVVIADEQTITSLDRYKEITRRLADPRKIAEEEAKQLIDQGKPLYYLTGAMHSPETGSPEMLMELAYRIAVEETPFIQEIRKNIITLITPVLEVDGRNRMVDTVRWQQANPKSPKPPLLYWGKYIAHDNNRDAVGMKLQLTKNMLNAFWEWHPQVIHDLHESVPFLYISTGTGPYNAWLDPVAIDEWHRMAYHEVQALTEKGLPGVWTHGFYDGWAPSYMFWIAHGHNAIGRFYETFGNSSPATMDRVVRERSQREWYRPNPPYPKVKWSLRNNINYQQSGVLLALHYMASNRQHFLQTFWNLGKRAIAKATNEGPAAYVFDANQKRKGQLRDLMNLLRTHGIEVHQSEKAFSLKNPWPPKKKEEPAKNEEGKDQEKKEAKKEEKKEDDTLQFSANSFIVRLDQPYSRMADALLDTQYVRGEERIYDDTGWTLGYAKNVEFKRMVNLDVLKVPMRLWEGKSDDRKTEWKGKAVAITNSADTDLIRLRYAIPDVKFFVTEEEWKRKNATSPTGTVLISLEANSKQVQDALTATSLDYTVVDSMPSVKMHELAVPRIALLHTWMETQDEGWYRIALDEMKVPHDYISTQDVAATADLRSKYDVILFPPVGTDSVTDIVNGMAPGPPLPWKKSELTPNLAVDQTEDMRPGMGLNGVQNLKRFVEEGGTLIAVGDAADWAIQYGLAKWVTKEQPQNLKVRGSFMNGKFLDRNSPISYGYDETTPVYFNGSLLMRVGLFGPDRRAEKRTSGRGSLKDPDVPQGRPFVETPEKPKPEPWEEGFKPPDEIALFYEPYLPKMEDRPRVILSFPKEADQILLSGMLEGADELAGRPLIVDSPLGKGHIVLFAINPIWRGYTDGMHAMVFNTIFHYQHLNLGWPPAAK